MDLQTFCRLSEADPTIHHKQASGWVDDTNNTRHKIKKFKIIQSPPGEKSETPESLW